MMNNRICEILEEQGRTQSWLAKKVGVTRGAVGNYCSNVHQPRMELLVRIAEALEVNMEELVKDE